MVGLQQKNAGSYCWIIDVILFVRLEYVHNEPFNFSWSIELPTLLAGIGRELLDKVFICISEYVRAEIVLSKLMLTKVINQLLDGFIREAVAICEVQVIKDFI